LDTDRLADITILADSVHVVGIWQAAASVKGWQALRPKAVPRSR